MKKMAIILVFFAIFGLGLMPAAEAAAPPNMLNTTWAGSARGIHGDGTVGTWSLTLHFSGQSNPPGLYSGTLITDWWVYYFTAQITFDRRITMVIAEDPFGGAAAIAEGVLTGKHIHGVLRGVESAETGEFSLTKQ